MRRRPGWAVLGSTWLAACLVAAPATAEWVDWIAGADAGFRYDSNLNNAARSSEEEYDLIWRPEGKVGRVYQFADNNTRLDVTAEIRGAIHHRWSRLNAVTGLGGLSLFHKLGLGDAPWARAFFTGGYEKIRDDERSGSRFEVGAQFGKRFSPRFDASLTYQFTAKDGDRGRPGLMGVSNNVWDQEFHEVIVDGRFLVTEQLLATAGYGYQHGDFYSQTDSMGMAVLMDGDVKAAALDDVFGGLAYRLKGNTHSPFVSLNYGFCDRFSIDASYRYRYSKSESLDYESHITQLTLMFRY